VANFIHWTLNLIIQSASLHISIHFIHPVAANLAPAPQLAPPPSRASQIHTLTLYFPPFAPPPRTPQHSTTAVNFSCRSIPLGDAYAVTDFFAQGATFSDDECWISHLVPPPDNPISRASLLVTLTRYKRWSNFHHLGHLWPPGDATARDAIVTALHSASLMQPQLVAELHRLQQLATATEARLAAQP